MTAYPIHEEGEPRDALPSIKRFLDSCVARTNLTVSSGFGASLPSFDAGGNCTSMNVGAPASLPRTLAALLANGHALESVLPFFTSNVARAGSTAISGREKSGETGVPTFPRARTSQQVL